MQIITNYKNCPLSATKSVVAIGNFDGVHCGHVAVINQAKAIAAANGLKVAVLTFVPHPLQLLRPDIQPFLITDHAQKFALIESLGVDYIFAVDFNTEFSQISAESFISEVLVDGLKASHVITGENFTFGHKRQGSSELLEETAGQYNFIYSKIMPIGGDEGLFSSSQIRQNLRAGKLRQARQMLGRNFVINGTVVRGKQLGSKIGFPTINIELGAYLRPAFGVYAAKVNISGAEYYGAANIGNRPTIDGTTEMLEVYLFDFAANIYDEQVAVELVEFIRPEKKFGGVEELQRQIEADCIKIKEGLA